MASTISRTKAIVGTVGQPRTTARGTVRSMDADAAERLDAFRKLVLRDGWPDWLAGSWLSVDGPTVQLRLGTLDEVRQWVEELAREHRIRVVVGDTYFLPENG